MTERFHYPPWLCEKWGERYEHVEQADFSHLKYLMVCGCGFPNSRHKFEEAIAQFGLCFLNHHTIITVPESPMFNVPEAESVTKPRLELLRQAGRKYAENGKIELELLEQIGSPMIPEDVHAKEINQKLAEEEPCDVQLEYFLNGKS